MQNKNWVVSENGFEKEKIELLGSKFTIGNGSFGFRGTLEEFTAKQLVACTVSEIYDDNGSGWREIVNVPNMLYTRAYCLGTELSVLQTTPSAHTQQLCLKNGVHSRETVFTTENGTNITIKSQRFASIANPNLFVMKYTACADRDIDFTAATGFDKDIWDLNGPHYSCKEYSFDESCPVFNGKTIEKGYTVSIAACVCPFGNIQKENNEHQVSLTGRLLKGEDAGFITYAAIVKNSPDTRKAVQIAKDASKIGYDMLRQIEDAAWDSRWHDFDVCIEGDDEAQLALRHSIFLLMTAAPFNAKDIAIPARGLSGQVYKGAMFWDTEMYFLPMFLHTAPSVARSLVSYRIKNLDGALKKAAEEGYEGAFYPWECQETGQEGCTYYNLTDIFTNRPVRTYFRDKQIHISAATAHGILSYARATGDYSLLKEGGAKVLLQCVSFFWSYAYYKANKQRYEFLDVTGPDEYHERVNNNAYTNAMICETAKGAIWALEQIKGDAEAFAALQKELPNLDEICRQANELSQKTYVPSPRNDGVIEQYDGFFKQEDCTLEELRSRIINPNEYLGSPTGLTVNTQIAKQADIVLLLTVLGNMYTDKIKQANWEYYEPRCEHGSSLSTCVYALLAAQLGKTEWAYKYFMKAASLDLCGNYKLYLGPLYIGGTHPAANGGSWMVAVQGFAGLSLNGSSAVFNPHLPSSFKSLSFRFTAQGDWFSVNIKDKKLTVCGDNTNKGQITIIYNNTEKICSSGSSVSFLIDN